MSQITRDIYVLSNKVKEPIDYVRFTNALPIVFTFRDYDIPSGATVTVFCAKPSGKAVYTDAVLSGNTVTITVTDQMFIELGTTILQVKIENNGTTLVTFGWPVNVHENSTEGDIPPSQNQSGFWDELQQQVDEAVENCNNAVDSVNQVIQESQQATQNANNAADNANEAAQQVFDKQYVLTANQTFGLSDTVQPTSEGNALVESIEGDTWQGENPSPENPQHIYGIGDTGYFDGVWEQGWVNNTTGVAQDNQAVVYAPNKIPCKPGDSIKIIHETTVDCLAAAFYREDGTFIQALASERTVSEYKMQAPSGAYSFVPEVQIDAGVTPQTAGHIAVTINGKYAVKVDCVGKNLIEYPYLYSNTTVYGVTLSALDDGSYLLNGNSTGNSVIPLQQDYTDENNFKIILRLEAGKKYFAKDVQVFIMNNGISSAIKAMDSQQIYTAKEGDLIAGFMASIADGETYSSNRIYYPIFCEYEEGMNTDYIPYRHSLSYLPISSPLYKGDSIVKINGVYKIRRVNGVAVFDGSEDEGWYVNQYTNLCAYIAIPSLFRNNDYLHCDYFKTYDMITGLSDGTIGISIEGVNEGLDGIFIGIKGIAASVEEWRAWLQSNPITVVYKSKITIYEEIPQEPFYNLMAVDELTNVSLLGENENLVPTNVIKFPRNDDGALCTTAYAVAKKYEDAYQGMTPSGIEDRLAALETQMAALNAQTIIVE